MKHKYVKRYLKDGELEIDNNLVEPASQRGGEQAGALSDPLPSVARFIYSADLRKVPIGSEQFIRLSPLLLITAIILFFEYLKDVL